LTFTHLAEVGRNTLWFTSGGKGC